uniref:Uncharacterized protein n=1 Tax=Trichogramma kaykai TaxID=54128 RepID=A0ABD2VYL7_9HYME
MTTVAGPSAMLSRTQCTSRYIIYTSFNEDRAFLDCSKLHLGRSCVCARECIILLYVVRVTRGLTDLIDRLPPIYDIEAHISRVRYSREKLRGQSFSPEFSPYTMCVYEGTRREISTRLSRVCAWEPRAAAQLKSR